MANNKVQLADGTVLMDVTDTTALASTVKSGDIFYNAAGVRQTGTLIVDETYSIQQNLTNVTSSVDDTKVIAGNCFYTKLTPSEGYNILSVIVTMGGVDITEQVFEPGLREKTITQNGIYNASVDSAIGYSQVIVNVSNSYTSSDEGKVVSNGVLTPQTSVSYTINGTYDTTFNNSVTVDVPTSSATLITKSITANGTYNASSDNADGYSSVTVNVSGGGGTNFGVTGTNTLSEMFYALEHNQYSTGTVTVSSYFPANTESVFCDTGFADILRGIVIFNTDQPSTTSNSYDTFEVIGFCGLPSSAGADQSFSSVSSTAKVRNTVSNSFFNTSYMTTRVNGGKLYITPKYAKSTYTYFQIGHTYRWIAWPYVS